MSGTFSKEQRRNLVKAVGATAFEAMERAQQLAYQTEMRSKAMALEFLNFEKTTRETVERQDTQLKQLENRCNGLGEWCQGNEDTAKALATAVTVDAMKFEQLAGTLKGRLDATDQQVRNIDEQLLDLTKLAGYAGLFMRMSFTARVMWALFGTLPASMERLRRVLEASGADAPTSRRRSSPVCSPSGPDSGSVDAEEAILP